MKTIKPLHLITAIVLSLAIGAGAGSYFTTKSLVIAPPPKGADFTNPPIVLNDADSNLHIINYFETTSLGRFISVFNTGHYNYSVDGNGNPTSSGLTVQSLEIDDETCVLKDNGKTVPLPKGTGVLFASSTNTTTINDASISFKHFDLTAGKLVVTNGILTYVANVGGVVTTIAPLDKIVGIASNGGQIGIGVTNVQQW